MRNGAEFRQVKDKPDNLITPYRGDKDMFAFIMVEPNGFGLRRIIAHRFRHDVHFCAAPKDDLEQAHVSNVLAKRPPVQRGRVAATMGMTPGTLKKGVPRVGDRSPP